MANKKIEIRPVGDGDFGDILFPKTSADMVVDEVNGGTVADFITEVRNKPEVVIEPKPSAEVYFVGRATHSDGVTQNVFHINLPEGVTVTNGLGLSFETPMGLTNYTIPVSISINGTVYPIHKGSTRTRLTSISALSMYTIRYSSHFTLFFLQGEGGDYGNATAAEVLSGRTFGTDTGLVSGTMTNNSSATSTGTRRTSASGYIDLSPAAGYYDGSANSKTRISDSNFTAANIKSGISMFGLTGTHSGNYVTKETTVQLTSGITTYTVPFTNLGFVPKYWIASVGSLKYNGQSLALCGLIPPLGCPSMSVYLGNVGAYYMGSLRGQYDSSVGRYTYSWDTIVAEDSTNKSYTSGNNLYYRLNFYDNFSTYRFDTQLLYIRIDAWS